MNRDLIGAETLTNKLVFSRNLACSMVESRRATYSSDERPKRGEGPRIVCASFSLCRRKYEYVYKLMRASGHRLWERATMNPDHHALSRWTKDCHGKYD